MMKKALNPKPLHNEMGTSLIISTSLTPKEKSPFTVANNLPNSNKSPLRLQRIIPARTKETYGTTKRLKFNRRSEMKTANVVVINFEGVLGDIFKESFWE
jgi:hypothetical protein